MAMRLRYWLSGHRGARGFRVVFLARRVAHCHRRFLDGKRSAATGERASPVRLAFEHHAVAVAAVELAFDTGNNCRGRAPPVSAALREARCRRA